MSLTLRLGELKKFSYEFASAWKSAEPLGKGTRERYRGDGKKRQREKPRNKIKRRIE